MHSFYFYLDAQQIHLLSAKILYLPQSQTTFLWMQRKVSLRTFVAQSSILKTALNIKKKSTNLTACSIQKMQSGINLQSTGINMVQKPVTEVLCSNLLEVTFGYLGVLTINQSWAFFIYPESKCFWCWYPDVDVAYSFFLVLWMWMWYSSCCVSVA